MSILFIEEFISSVEKNEEAFVHGVAIGNTMPYYFELSYKPGEKIKYSMISEHSVLKDEFFEIYDTEAFCRFSGEMESLTLPKIELWPGEQLKFSPEQDVPGKAVTLEKAKEKATEIMVLTRLENDEYSL